MERTTDIGGIFFKAKDPDGLQKRYEGHLGLKPDPDGCVVFRWRERNEKPPAKPPLSGRLFLRTQSTSATVHKPRWSIIA